MSRSWTQDSGAGRGLREEQDLSGTLTLTRLSSTQLRLCSSISVCSQTPGVYNRLSGLRRGLLCVSCFYVCVHWKLQYHGTLLVCAIKLFLILVLNVMDPESSVSPLRCVRTSPDDHRFRVRIYYPA